MSKQVARNMNAMVFNPELQTFSIEKVLSIDTKHVETKHDLLPMEDAKKFVSEKDGQVYYIYNVDLPARLETSNLKMLRRSTALQRIFDYDKEKPFDLFKLMPYLIIALLIFFK